LREMQPFVTSVFIALFALSSPASTHKPTWAKKGVRFDEHCFSDSLKDCKPLRIPSPDGLKSVHVSYKRMDLDNGVYTLNAQLDVETRAGQQFGVGHRGFVELEIQWSPDSRSFFINGSDGGEGPEYIDVYHLGDVDRHPLNVLAAQKDMMESFPPCRAKGADAKLCAAFAEHPEEINVNAVDWTRGSSAIAVMAEMPCSSAFGGILCQVLGYEVEVSSGRILSRMNAREFAHRWQHSMAWKFEDPGPPEYEHR
jgi:hypothetical protein